jgi:hypothetical protein
MVRTPYGSGPLPDKRRNDHEDNRKDRSRLQLQLREWRLPLQSVHLQELQLLSIGGPHRRSVRPATICPYLMHTSEPPADDMRVNMSTGAVLTTTLTGSQRLN